MMPRQLKHHISIGICVLLLLVTLAVMLYPVGNRAFIRNMVDAAIDHVMFDSEEQAQEYGK